MLDTDLQMLAERLDEAAFDKLDQRIVLRGVSWAVYDGLVRARGDCSVPRMAYLEGVLELMSPGMFHEGDETKLARLVEAYSDEKGIPFEGYGSWTIRKKKKECGLEPDECYVVGPHDPKKTKAPHLAFEVIYTSGSIDKLEIYKRLGVREVWFWKRGALSFHALRRGRYVKIARSELLPEIDPAFLGRFMAHPTQTEAVRALRAAMRRGR